jgi:hypothetical protein
LWFLDDDDDDDDDRMKMTIGLTKFALNVMTFSARLPKR